jgi:hypothetical protein
MMHLSISRTWLFSRTARRVYFLCALADLALLGTRMGIGAALAAAGASELSRDAAMIVRTLLFPAVVGSAVLFVGMSYCWLGIGGSYKKKVLWFIFAPLFLLSMPVYYFVYYRPLASRQTEQALVPHSQSQSSRTPS